MPQTVGHMLGEVSQSGEGRGVRRRKDIGPANPYPPKTRCECTVNQPYMNEDDELRCYNCSHEIVNNPLDGRLDG